MVYSLEAIGHIGDLADNRFRYGGEGLIPKRKMIPITLNY
jgi:hypothetical protein